MDIDYDKLAEKVAEKMAKKTPAEPSSGKKRMSDTQKRGLLTALTLKPRKKDA